MSWFRKLLYNKQLLFGFIVASIAVLIVISALTTKPISQTPASPPELPKEELTEEELTIPIINDRVEPQIPAEGASTGELLVTSQLQYIKVMINPPDEEVAPNITKEVYLTPFRVGSLKPGRYSLIASKEGYSFTTEQFVIEPGKITRINIELAPLQETP